MKSRIILKTADFSGNNIGRYVELSEFTKKVLTKQTQYSTGSDEAIALNIFLDALENEGFIGGDSPLLKTLIIPALARQHDEFFFNIAQTDENGYPVDWMPASEGSAQTKLFVPVTDAESRIVGVHAKTDNGRITSEDATTQSTFGTGFGFSGNTTFPDVSLALYNLTTATSGTEDYLMKVFSGATRMTTMIMGARVGSVNYGFDVSGSMLGFLGLTFDNSGLEFNACADNAILSDTGNELSSSIDTGAQTYDTLQVGTFVYSSGRQTRLAMIACGKKIIASKMQIFQSLVDELMTALHVKSYIQ